MHSTDKKMNDNRASIQKMLFLDAFHIDPVA